MTDELDLDPARAGRRDTDAIVTYDVRELLAEIKSEQAAGFARLEKAMESKADRTDLTRLETRLEGHETRLDKVEGWQHDRELTVNVHTERDQRTFTLKQKVWGALGTLLVAAATVFGPYVGTHI